MKTIIFLILILSCQLCLAQQLSILNTPNSNIDTLISIKFAQHKTLFDRYIPGQYQFIVDWKDFSMGIDTHAKIDPGNIETLFIITRIFRNDVYTGLRSAKRIMFFDFYITIRSEKTRTKYENAGAFFAKNKNLIIRMRTLPNEPHDSNKRLKRSRIIRD